MAAHETTARRGAAVRPRLESLESRELLSQVATPLAVSPPYPMQVMLAPRMAMGSPHDGITIRTSFVVVGRTLPDRIVGMDTNGDGRLWRGDRFTKSDDQGLFAMRVRMGHHGVDRMEFGLLTRRKFAMVPLTLVSRPRAPDRPFNGSPTPGGEPFDHLIPDSRSYGPGVTPRGDARDLSRSIEEDPDNPAFAPDISLGLVFFGQFVDHDVTLMNVVGQGSMPDPSVPRNVRTPALDLDSVYGAGPARRPELYTPDGLFFRLGAGGQDLLRDANGRAIIGDERNDENGQIAKVHLAFQRLHNAVMTQELRGVNPAFLNTEQKAAVFAMTRRLVVGYYQGIVANQWAPKLTGRTLPEDVAPRARLPFEFSGAVYRVGHTLIPNRVVVDEQGTLKSPVDPSLRGPGAGIPYTLLFGPDAQPAAALDDKIAPVMRELLIPFSPTDPNNGDMVGGDAPNIGHGQIIDGVMHLDLIETNIVRGREMHLPSGEEYFKRVLLNQPYDPATDGNTDLFLYMLEETAENHGKYGPVGRDIFERSLGGILAMDPYRYNNPAVFTPVQIAYFRHATFEQLLHTIGEPGF